MVTKNYSDFYQKVDKLKEQLEKTDSEETKKRLHAILEFASTHLHLDDLRTSIMKLFSLVKKYKTQGGQDRSTQQGDAIRNDLRGGFNNQRGNNGNFNSKRRDRGDFNKNYINNKNIRNFDR